MITNFLMLRYQYSHKILLHSSLVVAIQQKLKLNSQCRHFGANIEQNISFKDHRLSLRLIQISQWLFGYSAPIPYSLEALHSLLMHYKTRDINYLK